jgi:endoglucanase
MKSKLFILPIATAALVMVGGCQSSSTDSTKTSPDKSQAAGTTGVATASTPVPAVTAPPVQPKPALPTIRINAGGGAVKDSTGVEWLAETGFAGGDVIERPDLPIANTKQPEIYRSEHYSMDSFSQKLPDGKYQVRLHFCETFEGISAPGERVFSFNVEGKEFKDFDVWVKSGGAARAYVETVPVEITDGQLDIKFTPQVENPQINAIEIAPAP